jgi:hypothetical protein
MRNIARAMVVSIALLVPATAHAQSAVFGAQIGMLVLHVHTQRTAVFEEVIAELVGALNGGGHQDPSRSPGGIRFLRATADPATGRVPYIVMVDAPVPGIDYSLEGLVRQFIPERAVEVNGRLAFALDNVQAGVLDLTVVGKYSPTDALRSRLDSLLGGLRLPGNSGDSKDVPPPPSKLDLEKLKGPLWSVDQLDVTVGERSLATWRIDWKLRLRNASLQSELTGSVAVDFKAADGSVLHTVQTFVTVPLDEIRELSGQIRLPANVAERIASSAVRVDPR